MPKTQNQKVKELPNKDLIRLEFERRFEHFIFPFKNADVERLKLPEPRRYKYLDEVSTWVNSEAYKTEHESMVREFYKELAIKPLTDDMITGYRLALVAIQQYEKRLSALAEEFKTTKKINVIDRKI